MQVWAMDGWVIAMEGREVERVKVEARGGREEEKKRSEELLIAVCVRKEGGDWRLERRETEERIVTGQRSRRCGDTGKRAVHKTFLARYRRGIPGIIIIPTQTDRQPHPSGKCP